MNGTDLVMDPAIQETLSLTMWKALIHGGLIIAALFTMKKFWGKTKSAHKEYGAFRNGEKRPLPAFGWMLATCVAALAAGATATIGYTPMMDGLAAWKTPNAFIANMDAAPADTTYSLNANHEHELAVATLTAKIEAYDNAFEALTD